MDFNTRFYLVESVQQILKTFGENCVLSGLELVNPSIDEDNNIHVDITPGKVIIDSTMIEFPTTFNINFNVDVLSDTGFVVLVLSFRYLRTSRMNQSIVSLKYVDDTNNCSNWFVEKDRLILSKLNFNKTTKTITVEESTFTDKKECIVNSNTYEIRPFNLTIQQLRPLLKQLKDG